MEIKTLRFADKQVAFKEIRQQYGPDAVIIDTKMVRSRKGLFGLFSPKVCQVVVAYQQPEQPLKPLGATGRGFGRYMADDAQLPPVRSEAATERHLDAAFGTGKSDALKSYRSSMKPEPAAELKRPERPIERERPEPEEKYEPKPKPEQKPEPKPEEREQKPEAKEARPEAPQKEPEKAEKKEKPAIPTDIKDILKQRITDYAAGAAQPENDAEKNAPEDIELKVDELKSMLQRFTDRMEYANCTVESGYSPEINELLLKLIGAGVELNTAHELARKTQKMHDTLQANPERSMRKNLKEMLGEPRQIKCEHGKCKVVMLIGPTGVGKTTTLAKLAASFSVKQNYEVAVVNADIFRIGAKEQLSSYADIMNLPCITVHSADELKDAINQFSDKELVLIDTTGRAASDKPYQEQMKAFIENCEIDQIYLTLTSTTADRVLREIIRQHSFIKDYAFIMTKTDEDVSLGSFVNVSKFSGKPLGYYTMGQNVPDDIMSVDTEEIVDKLLK